MEIKKILEVFDSLAPLSLSDDAIKNLGFYDNSGLLVDCGGDTQSVVCALDLTDEVIDYAVSVGSKLIITHHPAIYRAIKNINGTYVKAIKNGITVYSAHLCLDTATNGIEDCLACFAGAESSEILQNVNPTHGFGRKFLVKSQTAESVVNELIAKLSTNKYMFFGDKSATVNKVATFCGAGLNEQGIASARDCELLISADISHHVLLSALNQGKCVLQLTHYASEVFAMKKFTQELFENQLKMKYYFYTDKRFL